MNKEQKEFFCAKKQKAPVSSFSIALPLPGRSWDGFSAIHYFFATASVLSDYP